MESKDIFIIFDIFKKNLGNNSKKNKNTIVSLDFFYSNSVYLSIATGTRIVMQKVIRDAMRQVTNKKYVAERLMKI